MSRNIYIGIFVLSLCALLCVVQGSVLGIDLGGEFMKISSISPGRLFMIVENTATKRKTQSAVAFQGNERWFEADAPQKKSRALTSTFTFIQKYLGKLYDEGLIQQNKEKFYDVYKFEKSEKGGFQFAVDNFKLDDIDTSAFTVEELVGMYIKHAKILADKQTNMNIRDVVVTVPPFYGIPERVALAEAVTLASLKPLAFVHENTAAALYYAIERKDENKTHTVLFYNLGSTSLKVTLVEFTMENSTERGDPKGKKYESFTVLADAWEDVGGYQFDLNLANWLADEYDNQPSRKGKARSRDSPAAMAKLIKEANRAKEVLSANKETSVYVEALMDDRDLKATVLRSKFEEINQAAFDRLTVPIQKVLDATGKKLSDIDVIEVLGGGVRVPKVQQILQDFVGKETEVGAHMNGDEAMALGTSFHAASMSASFKTRPVYMHDGNNFPIYVTIRGANSQEEAEPFEKNTTLFAAKEKYGSKKAFTFTYDKDLDVYLYTKDANGNDEIFVTYHINNTNELAEKQNANTTTPKINLAFQLNRLGLVDLLKSEVSMEETILVEEVVKKKSKPAPKKEKKVVVENNETSTNTTSENGEPGEQPAGESPTKESNDTTADETPQPEIKYKEKTITHSVDLPTTREVAKHLQFSEETIKNMLQRLEKIEEFEELKRKRAEAKNRLEAFVYRSQELTGDEEFQSFATEEELDQLRAMALDNDDWLYSDEGRAATIEVFEERYDKITGLANKILFRQAQWQTREQVIEEAYKTIDSYPGKVKALNDSKPWITESAKDGILTMAEETKKWLNEAVEKLTGQKKTEDPLVSTADIEDRLTKLRQSYNIVRNTPKPKEKFKTDSVPDEILFDFFLKSKNITISGVDDSMKNMFRTSMKDEYETWKTEFIRNYTEFYAKKTASNDTEGQKIPEDNNEQQQQQQQSGGEESSSEQTQNDDAQNKTDNEL